MRLTKKKIQEILVSIVGEDGLPLINDLIGQENISEFDLAETTGFDIKVVRRLLYLLYNQNVIKFTRKKDKLKGWYIYYWTLVPDNIRFNYYKVKRELLVRLEAQLEIEEKEVFFISPNGGVRLNFDDAMEYDFHCPETGELMVQDDNKERIARIKRKIKETQDELKLLLEQRKARRTAIRERAEAAAIKKKAATRKKAAKKKVTKKKATKKKVTKKKVTKKKTTKKKVAISKKKETTRKKAAKKKVTKKKITKKKAVSKKKETTRKKAAKKQVIKKKIIKKKVAKKK